MANYQWSGLFTALLFFGYTRLVAPAITRSYEVGSTYSYDYELELEISEPGEERPESIGSLNVSKSGVGYRILTGVHISPVWHEMKSGTLLEIKLTEPTLQVKSDKSPSGFKDHSSNVQSQALQPLFALWKDGQITKIFAVEEEETSLTNIKKGIANILQVHYDSANVQEKSTLGQCKLEYKTDGTTHEKTVFGDECFTSDEDKISRSLNKNNVLRSTTRSFVSSKATTKKDSSIIESAIVSEKHVVVVSSKQEIGAVVYGSQRLQMKGVKPYEEYLKGISGVQEAVQTISKNKGTPLKESTMILNKPVSSSCNVLGCKKYEEAVKGLSSDKVANIKMASSFLQLVSRFRESSTEQIIKFLKPTSRVYNQLLDVCGATGSIEAHKAAMSSLKFNSKDHISHPERYLLSLAIAPRTQPEILNDIFEQAKSKHVKSEELKETLWLTAGALVRKLRESRGSSEKPSLTESQVTQHIISSLSSCKEPSCELMFLRSMINMKSIDTVDILFEKIHSPDTKISIAALQAINAMPAEYVDVNYRPVLIKVIAQLNKKYDSSVRTLAIDILLKRKPSEYEIKQLVSIFSKNFMEKRHSEVAKFLFSRLYELDEKFPGVKQMLENVISSENINNYHHLSLNGMSTAFSRKLFSSPSSNATFSNAIETSNKVLKRSSFDLFISNPTGEEHLFSLGVFAVGLDSVANSATGDVQEDVQDDEEDNTSAGMELSLLGVKVRPIVFFNGKGELMSLLWMGAGSDRTTAIQGNALIIDELKHVPLYNGLVAEVNILGGLSYELAGQIQLSIWYKTANSLVENTAGFVLRSVVTADTSFVQSKVDYTIATEGSLHFTSDVSFADEVLMCLKLEQPASFIKKNIYKTERIPGSKHKLRRAKYTKTTVPGSSYSLNRKNSDLCRAMYKDEL